MTTLAQPVNKKPYMIISHECFDSKIFDNQTQRNVYMTLKKFADSNNQCFPGVKKIASVAKLSKRTIQKTLRKLKDKFLIGIEERFRADGSQTSNLYTLYDIPGLWTASDSENAGDTEDINNIENAGNTGNETETAKATIGQYKEFLSMLEAEGYVLIKKDDIPARLQDKFVLKSVSDDTIMAKDGFIEENQVTKMEEQAEVMPEDVTVQEKVSVSGTAMPKNESHTISKKLMSKLKNVARKEKEPASVPSKVSDTSSHTTSVILSSDNRDNTMPAPESQALEAYPLDWIKDYFGYNAMINKYPGYKKNIDSVMNILHTALNTNNKIIRIKGDKKPSSVVKGKLLNLKDEDIIYAIKTFLSQKVKIKNTSAYMVTLLYNSPEQRQLDMENEKQYETAVKNGQVPEPDGTQPAATTFLPLSRDIHPNNKFNNFMERTTTIEELDALEKRILGNLCFTTDGISAEED